MWLKELRAQLLGFSKIWKSPFSEMSQGKRRFGWIEVGETSLQGCDLNMWNLLMKHRSSKHIWKICSACALQHRFDSVWHHYDLAAFNQTDTFLYLWRPGSDSILITDRAPRLITPNAKPTVELYRRRGYEIFNWKSQNCSNNVGNGYCLVAVLDILYQHSRSLVSFRIKYLSSKFADDNGQGFRRFPEGLKSKFLA